MPFTNNKDFLSFFDNVEPVAAKASKVLAKANNPMIRGLSPFRSRLSNDRKNAFINEALTNPWFVLRELIRVPVGRVKRFIRMSDGEYLALMNTLNGNQTFVSAPAMTMKTTLLAVSILMYQPKVILLSSPYKDGVAASEKEIMKKIRAFVSEMPDYIKPYFTSYKPTFMDLAEYCKGKRKLFPVKGFDSKDVMIISDNYEFDDNITYSFLERVEKARHLEGCSIPWLLVSSVNPDLLQREGKYLNKLIPARYDNVAISAKQPILVNIPLSQIKHLKSDKAKIKYLNKMLKEEELSYLLATR